MWGGGFGCAVSGWIGNSFCALQFAPLGLIAYSTVQPDQEPEKPTCTVEVGGVPILGGSATHSFVRVIAPSGIPGSFGIGTTIMEGVDEKPKDFVKEAPKGLDKNRKYLNARLSATGYMAGSYTVSENIVFSETSAAMCDLATELMQRFNTYQNWTLSYSAVNGPNSNSFVHWLIKASQRLSDVKGPRRARGWNEDDKIPY